MNPQDQLNLLLKIDRLIDETGEEIQLNLGLVQLLADALHADLALLAFPVEGRGRHFEPHSVLDRREILNSLPAEKLEAVLQAAAGQTDNELLQQNIPLGNGALDFLALPLKSRPDLLGIGLVARLKKSFTPREAALFRMACIQIDNALRYWSLIHKYRRESQALRTVLKIDRIRDTSTTLEELLDRALAELCRVIPTGIGFIMLYDRSGNRLELRAVTDQSFLSMTGPLQRVYAAADEAIQTGRIVHKTDPDQAPRDLVGIPLILNNRVIGVLGVIHLSEMRSFTPADRQLLQAIASQMDTAIFERLQSQRLRETFGRSVGPLVMERLLQIDDRDLLKGERIEVSALFSDIRNFTAASGLLTPHQLERMMNTHLDAMVTVILGHEGTLDKFIGDGVMALFNTPERQADYALRAVRTALDMQHAQAQVMELWRSEGLPAQPIGIGIATGKATVGNFGSTSHAEYSAIGTGVNLAARLCATAEGGQILIDERTYQLTRSQVKAHALPPAELKGFSSPMPVWEVTGFHPE